MPAAPRCLFLLCALLCPAALAGCGGGMGLPRAASAEPSAHASGQAAFTVKWPARAAASRPGSRLLPAAAGSIVLTITRGAAVIASQTLARPASSLTFSVLPVGTLSVTASAYPTADGTGVVQASASAPLTITSGQMTPLTLTLADTVASISVLSAAPSLGVGGTAALTATAHDASGAVVLTAGSIGWTSSRINIAAVSSSGLVTGIAAGSALITATDSESGVSGTFPISCVTSSPYGGVPAAIPGIVEAENYDLGGEGVAYHDSEPDNRDNLYRSDSVYIENCSDTGGGYDVGGSHPGQYLNYTVNVSAAGSYTIGFRVASPNSGVRFHLENKAGDNLTGEVACPNTGGYQAWQTVSATAMLPAGIQTLKFVEDTAGENLNSLAFQRTGQVSGASFDDGAGPYGSDYSRTAATAFDGDPDTFYDCANASGGYTGIDIGVAMSISSITFAPRPNSYFPARMVGGVFEGSNTSATIGYTTLATVAQTPTYGLTNTLVVSDPAPYRWLRYRGPDGAYCNVAEIQFFH